MFGVIFNYFSWGAMKLNVEIKCKPLQIHIYIHTCVYV